MTWLQAECLHFQVLGENPSDFETTYNNNPALKIIVEDGLVDMMGDVHFQKQLLRTLI
jgi:hypothetical protein